MSCWIGVGKFDDLAVGGLICRPSPEPPSRRRWWAEVGGDGLGLGESAKTPSPSKTYTKALYVLGIGCCRLAPGLSVKSRYIVGVLVYIGDFAPNASPAITLTLIPSLSPSAISSLVIS
nr:hypothetical protein Iba_chr01dCG9180 [Ipomoea batatas]